MTEADKQPSASKKTTSRFGIGLFVPLAIAFGLFVLGILLGDDLDLADGELILTERGCQVLVYHGVEAQPLDGGGLCLLRAKYRFPSDTARFGRIRVETRRGRVEIELPGQEVVSKARF